MYTTENVVEKSFRLKKNDLNIDIVDLASETVALEENNILTVERKADTFNFQNNLLLARNIKEKRKVYLKNIITILVSKVNQKRKIKVARIRKWIFFLVDILKKFSTMFPQVDMKRGDNDENVEGSITVETVESMEGQEVVNTKTLKTPAK